MLPPRTVKTGYGWLRLYGVLHVPLAQKNSDSVFFGAMLHKQSVFSMHAGFQDSNHKYFSRN